MLVKVPVNLTIPPGVVVLTSATLVMVNSATDTLVAQRGSVDPDGQLLPAVVEVRVLARVWLPVSGLLTVTV